MAEAFYPIDEKLKIQALEKIPAEFAEILKKCKVNKIKNC